MLKLHKDIIAARGFWYFGHPYSDHKPELRTMRHSLGLQVNAKLQSMGVFVYNAINSTHEYAARFGYNYTHESWIELNHTFIDASCGMLVLGLPGWLESRGLREEMEYCATIGKPVYFLDANGNSVT